MYSWVVRVFVTLGLEDSNPFARSKILAANQLLKKGRNKRTRTEAPTELI